ncbi:MAG: hypothetical protein AVDCRST_MAG16-72 [uncultured Frankineae bacterium]|uniref:Uncharacterized protein n=1 Tax=uncultured Frankineae bacterium TaxID=437475 RepID=A0A6J4KRP6_9ACTN|nr:MAG: hypothetical protein AVDCRST_MAG16-72 [uncultured Frankineae bacterium]
MTRPSRRTERRDDIRTEAAFLGWTCVVLAVLGWSFAARLAFDDGRVAITDGGWLVLWSVLGLAGTVGAAACYAVSAVARLLAADPEDGGPGITAG